MNIDDLTIKQARELASMFGSNQKAESLNFGIGKNVIIRTYSAGVWCGTLEQKDGKEVVLKNARRLWRWRWLKTFDRWERPAPRRISIVTNDITGSDTVCDRVAD